MEFPAVIADPIVGEIAKCTIAPIRRQLGYLIHYQSNKEKLRVKIEELDGKKESIDTQIEEGRKRGEKTRKEVDNWLERVKTTSQEANEILKDKDHPKAECSCSGFFPNLVLRHQLSRKMKKMAETVASEIQKADAFRNNICRTPSIKRSFKNRDFEVFDTRMLTSREIMKALKDPNCSKIGVYGTGGVGKTTLVQEVARQAREEEKIFSEVVMVTVSQSFDLKSIQQEIAEQLGLPLKEKTEKARADRLKNRLKGETNILIILDDVWVELKLQDVGIDFDKDNQKGFGCKILLVSRDKHVLCNDMGVEKDIKVGVLSKEEALKLFNKFVGEEQYVEDLATDIVRYCGGLPVAIVPIAITLRNRDPFVWKNVLNNLKRCPEEGYGSAYPCIKTSYDFLKGKHEQPILLLCSLFKEDTNVSVEDLMNIYGAYSNMFSGVSLEEARVSVLTSVDNLKRCCLLSEGDKGGTVKLHDVIRRIMISIAQEKGMWCFEKSERHSNSGLDDSTAISLIDHDINQLLKSLACRRLRLLMHEESCSSSDSPAILFPEGFLEEAIELRALCLRSVIVKPLPLLSSSLQNLQTLSLQNCVFEDIAFIGELNNLVVLDLSNSEFERLPEQIGKLTCLRQLNMNNCTELKIIPPNVISRLVQLEELYMDCVCINWRTEAVGDTSENASLVEIKNMSQLRALHLCIGDANVLPRGMFVDGKLKRFNIMVGLAKYHNQATSSRLLQLKLHRQIQLRDYGFQMLMKECEELCLGTLQGVNNITSQLDADGFVRLKKLFIHENDEVQHIVESTGEIQPRSAFQNLETLELRSLQNIEKICCGSFRGKPFRLLQQITVSQCNKLKNVLPYFVDNRLEKIEIKDCNMVEEIVNLESEDHATNCDNIEFPHLRSLDLRRLPNLIHFFSSEMETTYCHASSTVTPGVPFFKAKVAFPSLESLELWEINCSNLWPNQLPTTSTLQNLTRLNVYECHKLKNVFPFVIVEGLMQLERLEVSYCFAMEEIIIGAEEEGMSSRKINLFPKLKYLELRHLESLQSFCDGDCNIELESLLELQILECPLLKSFASKARVDQEIGQPLINEKVAFPSLELLELEKMDFSELWPNQLPTTSTWQSLTRLYVFECHKLKNVFPFVIVGGLMQLERLEVSDCSAMEEIIIGAEEEGMSSRKINLFPKLKYLELRNLKSLQSFCDGDCNIELESLLELDIRECPLLKSFTSKTRVDEEIGQPLINEKVVFKNLQELRVANCKSLLCLWDLATFESLQQLKTLEVLGCDLMEEVLVATKEAGDHERNIMKISFPKLERVELKNLPKLKRFYQGDCTVEFPALSYFFIGFCQRTTEVEVTEMTEVLFNEKVAFPSLDLLNLYMTHFSALWPNQLPATSTSQNFTRLRVSDCRKLKYVFPFVIVGGLRLLEELELTYCSAIEVIIRGVEEGMSSKKILFPKLKCLKLKNLESLKSFCDGDCNVELESLLKLTIRECPLLKSFTSKTRVDEEIGQPLINEKVAFPSLDLLNLYMTHFSALWPNQLPATSTLQNLTRLNVSDCRKLKFVFPFVIVGGLTLLEELVVTNCSAIEVIIRGVEEGMSSKKILFPKLKCLELKNLESLKSFCDGDCNVELESLLKLTIRECPLLKSFTSKTRVDEEIGQPLINEKVVFKNLQELRVENCKSLLCLWDLATFESLQQLKTLEVLGCDLMEEVLVATKEAGDHERNIMKISFPKLETVELKNLPKLKRFYQGDCTVEFPALSYFYISKCQKRTTEVEDTEMTEVLFNEKVAFPSLELLELDEMDFSELWPNQLPATSTLQNLTRLNVCDCRKLKFVFPFVIVGGLMQLERLDVSHCSAIEVIIRGVEEGMSSKKILFPKLKCLKLKNLESLKSFCDEDCNVELESLLELTIRECPLLKGFTSKTRVDEEIGQPLINEKVVFRTLQNLTIGKCNSLLSLWELATSENIQHLEKLEIFGCELMEEIFVVPKEAGDQVQKLKKISFPKLENLALKSLPKLKRFCQGDCTIEFLSTFELEIQKCTVLRTFIANSTCSTSIVEKVVEEREKAEEALFNGKVVFRTLQNLTIGRCNSLLSLWELATSENIQHLEKLEIFGCELMEEIFVVAKEAGDQEQKLKKISFPKLENLALKSLPKLKRFCQGDCTIEFLSALELEIQKCTVLRTVIANSTCSTSAIEKVVEEREMAEEALFNGKVVFRTLQKLTIGRCNSLLSLWELATSENIQHLEKLEIFGCELMEEIFVVTKEAGDQERKSKISFPKLESLKLKDLPKLRRFCQGECTIEFLSASELEIQNCTVLRTFIANSTCSTSATEKVDEEREMAEEALFNGKVAFYNLERLSVERCENLKYLLTFAIAGKLVQLKKLKVAYCSMMEEMVVVAEDEGGERMSSRKILFPKLRSLNLKYLTSLKEICAGDCIIGCESSSASVTSCPLLKTLNEKVAFPIC